MVELLLFGDACAGVPGGRQSRLRSDAKLPRQTAQSGHSWQSPLLSGRCVRRTRRAANGTRLLWIVTDSFTTKSIGEPDAGNRHVRFDERGWETGGWPTALSHRARPRLYFSSPNSRRMFLAEKKGRTVPLAPVDLAKGEQHS